MLVNQKGVELLTEDTGELDNIVGSTTNTSSQRSQSNG